MDLRPSWRINRKENGSRSGRDGYQVDHKASGLRSWWNSRSGRQSMTWSAHKIPWQEFMVISKSGVSLAEKRAVVMEGIAKL